MFDYTITFLLGSFFLYVLLRMGRASSIGRANEKVKDMDLASVDRSLHELDSQWSRFGYLSDDNVYLYAALRSRRSRLLRRPR